MHPGFFNWWKQHRHHGGCGSAAWCGPDGAEGGSPWHGGHAGGWSASAFDGGGFGVRRPLRFLANKLELREEQVSKLAVILAELKTERAQAAVDDRRRTTALADALEQSAFDAEKIAQAGAEEAKSAERLRAAIARALQAIHDVLDAEQRKKLAYLLRTGQLVM